MRKASRRHLFAILLAAMVATAAAARLEAAMGVALQPNLTSPEPVGTVIRWTAQVSGGSGDFWYRYRVSPSGGAFHVIRDFGPLDTLDWTALDEGRYMIELTVQDRASHEVKSAVSTFQLTSRAAGGPVVNSTSHPLVFLFSSPGCQGGRARARYQAAGGPVQLTPFQPCTTGHSLNFYLAGLTPNTSYSVDLVVEQLRTLTTGPLVTFATGDASYPFPQPTVVQADGAPGREKILLQVPLYAPPFATDLDGNLVWYGPGDLHPLTRPEAGGTFFGIVESLTDPSRDAVRQFDLTGMTLRETNAARVSEQLVAMGQRAITGFHHEARSIGSGRIAVLAGVEQILTDIQGPGSLDVLGDMIVVLDADMQVVWSWDTFDYLDVSRRAILGEICSGAAAGCAPYYLAPVANDWTHGNSLALSPDGALLFSIRHQDWVVKIDYGNGSGSGDVIWRLGPEGDFTLDSSDPSPWFSHQHDVEIEPGTSSTIMLFDNGNTRWSANPQATSRGQVLELDELNHMARLALNADLGVLSFALGSAQRLADGNYHFDAGYVPDAQAPFSAVAYSFEIAPAGDLFSSIKLLAPVYRSFRLVDLYGATEEPERLEPRVVGFRE